MAVPDGATFCPACGKPSHLNAASADSDPSTPPRIKQTKKGSKLLGCLGIGVVIVLVLILVGSLAAPKSSNLSTDSNSSNSTDVVDSESPEDLPLAVTSTQLFNAFQNNEASAQGYFGKRKLFVTGTVHKVSLDMWDNPVVELVTPNQFMPAQASLAEDAKDAGSKINGGDKAHLICEDISEVASIPMLKDCRPAPADTKTQKVHWAK